MMWVALEGNDGRNTPVLCVHSHHELEGAVVVSGGGHSVPKDSVSLWARKLLLHRN